MGIKSTAKGRCMVNVAWEEQANGPEGAYCRVDTAPNPTADPNSHFITMLQVYCWFPDESYTLRRSRHDDRARKECRTLR